jgi:hypothetical protein
MLDEIKVYFKERNEDEFYQKKVVVSDFLPKPAKEIMSFEIEANKSDLPNENNESRIPEGLIERIEEAVDVPKPTTMYQSFVNFFYGRS